MGLRAFNSKLVERRPLVGETSADKAISPSAKPRQSPVLGFRNAALLLYPSVPSITGSTET